MKGWKIPAFVIPRHLWHYANIILTISDLLTGKSHHSISAHF